MPAEKAKDLYTRRKKGKEGLSWRMHPDFPEDADMVQVLHHKESIATKSKERKHTRAITWSGVVTGSLAIEMAKNINNMLGDIQCMVNVRSENRGANKNSAGRKKVGPKRFGESQVTNVSSWIAELGKIRDQLKATWQEPVRDNIDTSIDNMNKILPMLKAAVNNLPEKREDKDTTPIDHELNNDHAELMNKLAETRKDAKGWLSAGAKMVNEKLRAPRDFVCIHVHVHMQACSVQGRYTPYYIK